MAYVKSQKIDFVKLNVLVETDSTCFNKSFKRQKFYLRDDLNDQSYGSFVKKKRGISMQKLCVTCAIDRKKHIFCKYTLNGKVSIQKLNETYKDKLDLAKINAVIIDGENSYKAFLHQLNIPTKILIRPKTLSKYIPLVEDIYHLQNLNQFYNYLKFNTNKKMHGIASKYLDCYLYWLTWLKMLKYHNISKALHKLTFLLLNSFCANYFSARNLQSFQITKFN